jgi:hypothetical protein
LLLFLTVAVGCMAFVFYGLLPFAQPMYGDTVQGCGMPIRELGRAAPEGGNTPDVICAHVGRHRLEVAEGCLSGAAVAALILAAPPVRRERHRMSEDYWRS